MEREVIVLPSALKRKFKAEDIAFVVRYPLFKESLLTGEWLYIGFINNVLVEILGEYSDNDSLIVFHCMKCRKKYLRSSYEH
jgi:hypothetical protein